MQKKKRKNITHYKEQCQRETETEKETGAKNERKFKSKTYKVDHELKLLNNYLLRLRKKKTTSTHT